MSDRAGLPAKTDVLIFGGGPAGIATALALTRCGLVCKVVERTSYEAARVGEHLSPDCQPVLESLALWARFIDSGHLPSDGIRVAWGGDSLYERDYMFSPYGRGWNLDRRRFDATLAADAAAAGVGVLT